MGTSYCKVRVIVEVVVRDGDYPESNYAEKDLCWDVQCKINGLEIEKFWRCGIKITPPVVKSFSKVMARMKEKSNV